MLRTLLLLPVLAACSTGPAVDATITPAWDAAAADRLAVPRTILGHNTVWSRGGLGLWDDATGALDDDVWPHVEALAPGALRFPGGTRGLRWHFAGTLGAADARVPQCDAFSGALDDTGYGLAEMLTVADRAAAPISLVTALSDGTPEEAAAMLAYVAGDPSDGTITTLGVDRAGTDWGTAASWAQRRAAAAAPVADVRLVEIGNEPYLSLAVGPSSSCGRAGRFHQDERFEGDLRIPITAADYASQLQLHAAALRAVDPTVVIGAAAMSDYPALDDGPDVASAVARNDTAAGTAWNPRLLDDAGDAFDAWVLHPYDFAATDDRITLAERARAAGRALRELAPDKRIAVTEFGTLFDADTQLNALLTADFVRIAVEEQWHLLMRHILIEDDPGGPFAASAAILGPEHRHTPGWEAARLLAEHLQATAVPVVIDAAGSDLVALATADAESPATLAVVLIDRRLPPDDEVLAVELRLPAGTWAGTATVVDAPALTSRDVTVTAHAVTGNGAVIVEVPPQSVTIVRLAR